MAENRGVQFRIEKLSDLKELQSMMQFYKNYYIGLN